MAEYTIQKGDSLWNIAKKITGNALNYKEIAKSNGILDPNKIIPGTVLVIPKKFDRPLKKLEIPTKNKVQIIDNYSPNYNYIIELDKMYYSKKNADHWVDISDNEKARKNLYNFIGNKYNFRGYEDDEKNIWNKITNNTFDYNTYRDSVNTAALDLENIKLIPKKNVRKASSKRIVANIELTESPLLLDNTNVSKLPILQYGKVPSLKKVQKNKILSTQDLNSPDEWYNFGNWIVKANNWILRLLSKKSSKPEDVTSLKLPNAVSNTSQYAIRPGTFTGDTIKVNSRRYIIPESIDVNQYTFGVRNRGANSTIHSEAAPITAFFPFKPYGSLDKNFKTYIGIDKNGKLIAGDISLFSDGSYLTGTYSNVVRRFKKDNQGNQVWKDDAAHGNSGRNVPILEVVNDDGTIKEGSINILTGKSDSKGTTYGNITGGRVLVRVGNELRLLSGSIKDIESQFEEMKKRNNLDHGIFYTLDNGSYNRGLRTYDKTFTKSDLVNYDLLNNGGGNFMYIKGHSPLNFRSDTIPTPNVRTVNDESYKKGHGLTNELKGVVLHHTAFMDDNLDKVTLHLTRPNGESAHVIIGYDGSRRVLANPNLVTFHSGHSVWNGRDNVNDFMLGIKFLGDTNKKPLTEELIKSAVEYLKPIIRANNISLEDIVTHKLVRDNYNLEARKQGIKSAPSKPDINLKEYNRILLALLDEIYYKKAKGGLIERKTKWIK